MAETERHVIALFLHMPGSSRPRRGHSELAQEWGWPDLGLVESSVAVEARWWAECTRKVLQLNLSTSLAGSSMTRGLPMALNSWAAIEEHAEGHSGDARGRGSLSGGLAPRRDAQT